MVRFTCTLLLLAGFSAMSIAQTTPAATPRPDAMELLQQISKKYTEAKYYHVEEVWETETRGDFSRDWRKSMETAILMPDNRYRFESKAQFGEMLKVSNGKTETNYNLTLKEYTQQPSPENGPQIPKGAMDMQQAKPEVIALQKRLKAAFDPDNLLNPGKIFPD